MTRTSAKVDVWNRALSAIGEEPSLEDPDDTARTACLIANKVWEDVLDEVLAAFPWAWARKQSRLTAAVAQYDAATTYASASLARSDEGRVYASAQAGNVGQSLDDATWWTYQYQLAGGWGYVYHLPDDCVTPLYLLTEGSRIALEERAKQNVWDMVADENLEGKLLVCDLDVDDEDFEALEYTARHEYVPGWPRAFLDAVVWRLAIEFALGIRKDVSQAERQCRPVYDENLRKARIEALNTGRRDAEIDTPSLTAR